ncbi:MAG: hypothetical protein MJ236_01225 [Clostridia bacterium]|nr:hypothetical protein [Clostridia bacterium]
MAEKTKAEMQAEIDKLTAALEASKKAQEPKEEKIDDSYLLEKVKIRIVKVPGIPELSDDYDVTINGKTWLIQRGVEVEVPRYVAEAVQLAEAQALHAEAVIKEIEESGKTSMATI